MTGNRIFITGGAGFLGKSLIKKYYDDNEITIYSRDEAKHYYIKKQYPKVNCIIGDIVDLDNLKRASQNHNIGIFAASLKQIEAVDQNYEVASRTIINGAINSRRVAEENGFDSACFISTDKSRAATTLYGAMKFVAGESFIVNSDRELLPHLSTAIYGNVMNSTGSIIPLIWHSIENGYPLSLYSPEMTRFMLSTEEAIDVIEHALDLAGYNVIPTVKSFRIKDLFIIYQEEFNLRYNVTQPRISEKIHEIMISSEEVPRVIQIGDYYRMHYKDISNHQCKFKKGEFSSRDYTLTREELRLKLVNYNYFKP